MWRSTCKWAPPTVQRSVALAQRSSPGTCSKWHPGRVVTWEWPSALCRHFSMKVEFYDRQDVHNPLNGQVVSDASALPGLLDKLQNRSPFFCELLGQNGYKILL